MSEQYLISPGCPSAPAGTFTAAAGAGPDPPAPPEQPATTSPIRAAPADASGRYDLGPNMGPASRTSKRTACQILLADARRILVRCQERRPGQRAAVEARTRAGRPVADALLSGPAGGIVGMARTAQAAGFGRVIGFDMGGTSTDVSHFAGELERQYETEVAGVRIRAPMLSIHTVAAGGGSVLHFDGGRYRVGPDSAGADPGPACYRRGGPLTLTDANVLL